MSIRYQMLNKTQSAGNLKPALCTNNRNAFVYSKMHEKFDLKQMYESLNSNVADLVDQNRIKLIQMNTARSKDLVSKTQNKLLTYMRAKPGGRKGHSTFNPNAQRTSKTVILSTSNEQFRQGSPQNQQIFDFNKLQIILKGYERNASRQNLYFTGVLAQKVIKLANKNVLQRSSTHRTLNFLTLQPVQRQKRYTGWKMEKSRRRLKHMFS